MQYSTYELTALREHNVLCNAPLMFHRLASTCWKRPTPDLTWNSQQSPLSAFGSKAWALRSTTVGQRAEESIARVEEEAGTAMTARSSLALAIFRHVNIM